MRIATIIITILIIIHVMITHIPHSSESIHLQVLEVIVLSVKLPDLLWQSITPSDRKIRGQTQMGRKGTLPEAWIRIVHWHESGLPL